MGSKKRKSSKPKTLNNLVAKHALTSGAGAHEFKSEHKKAKRAKQKAQFRKEMQSRDASLFFISM